MQILQNTPSHLMSLNETLTRLSNSDSVDGLAFFGSRATTRDNPVSDYDLLILVSSPPVPIFQMLTHIDGRMADLVFVETATADYVLALDEPVSRTSFEGLFLQKMLSAQIVYDASGRLERVQQHALTQHHADRLMLPPTESDLYAAWFWPNHGLFHLKRMVQSDDPVYLTAVDLMLMGGLHSIGRNYHRIRNLPWEGEKAAVRYLQEHDLPFLALLRDCIASTDRKRKVELYEQLVIHTIEPLGTLWAEGITAVWLRDTSQNSPQLEIALRFWEDLLR